jgi:hypothetical protein
MTSKLLAFAVILTAFAAVPAVAQQHPLDQGVADTLAIEIDQPQVGPASQTVTARVYIVHDVQRTLSLSSGFSWDNPKLSVDSVIWSPAAMSAFNFMRLEYFRSDRDSTNFYRRFQCTGMALFGTGMAVSTTRQLVATYYFKADNWTASDLFCITRETFIKLSFIDPSTVEYVPIWAGTTCVGFVPTGVLQTSPLTLNFSGVAGGANPVSQNFNVTEEAGQNIEYTATEGVGWITLTDATGTTPDAVGVNIVVTGLVAGDYSTQVTVTSAAATNEATVTVNLHLDQPNRPPVLNSIGNRSTNELQLLQFTVSASDPDGTTPILTTSTRPDGASFVDNGNGTGTFTWTPTFDQAGSYPVTFTASDGSLTDTEEITITVNNVNRPPVLTAIGPRQVLEGANLHFGLSGSDPDLTALTFSAVDVPAGAVLTDNHNGTATFDWTPSNTQSGFYGVTFIVSDGSLADSEVVSIEVIDADGFALSPNPLTFTANFGAANPAPQSFHVAISDGSNISFEASTTGTWITLGQATGTTPADVEVNISLAGLAAGHYRDSIRVAEAPVGQSTAALDPVWEYVDLTINNVMSVDPTSLSWTVSEGEASPVSQTFLVAESGGDVIEYSATTSTPWLMLSDATGVTPHTVGVSINMAAVDPGEYNGTIVVTTSAVNSPLEVAVHLVVTPCPLLVPATVVYNRTAFRDETVMFDEAVNLSSTGPGEIAWYSVLPEVSPYALDPTSGTTPSQIALHYEKIFGETGDFADTAIILAQETEGFSCPSQTMIITNVTVYRPASADTVIVVNTPAVPGMRVTVPVIFSNSCPLTGLGLSLNWTGGMFLDSVSFAGSAIAYIDDKNASINNDLGDVTITMAVGEQMLLPIGSEQVLANLYFALPCEIEEGTYGFGLGAYPPLTPADVYFYRDCGEGIETEFPEYIPGAIIVGTASNYVCGYVVDPDDNEIQGATVELWDDYPVTEPLMSTLSSSIGGFAFDEIMVIPFDLYAYKEGYYPGKVEDINFGDKGIKIVLTPIPDFVTPTSEWVDYFCPETEEGVNLFLGYPVPVGAIVEAYTQNGLLVGQTMVHERGKYGFMPVYRANDDFTDPGARTGDYIHFTINGMDAVATGNTMYPPDYAQIEVCLEVRGTIEKVCTLVEGWNLISWNVNTDSDNILNVLAPIMNYVDVVLGFEQGGLTFDPDLPVFSTLWNVDHLSGYWVRIQGIGQIDLTITGLPVVESIPIPLRAGWNLVSFLPEESWSVETALANVDHFTLFAYGFPNGQIQVWQPGGQFNQLETFDPCNGYWIKTTQSGTLFYNGLDSTPAEPRPFADVVALGSDGVIATTSWVNMYSRDLTLNGEQVTAGSTVRAHAVKSDQVVGSFTLTTNGQFGFMPVYADASGDNASGLISGEEFYLVVNEVKTDEVFTWTNNGDRIEVTQLLAAGSNPQVLPTGYSLEQNYPNPFNPSTIIRYRVPVTSRAKIEVFNVLGASVAVILNGLATAGEHEIVWNGRDDAGMPTASGVYFYRLTADNYTETRKMMLLK